MERLLISLFYLRNILYSEVGFMLLAFPGLRMVPGWITAGISVVLLFLSQFEPGPEAIRALETLQLLIAAIFLLLGITHLSSKVVKNVPRPLKPVFCWAPVRPRLWAN